MQDIGTRFLIAVGIIWLGLNLIALEMTENGSNRRWNPMWQFMAGFLDLEWIVFTSETFGSHPARQQARKGLTVSPLQVPPRTRNEKTSEFPFSDRLTPKILFGVLYVHLTKFSHSAS